MLNSRDQTNNGEWKTDRHAPRNGTAGRQDNKRIEIQTEKQ